MQYVRVCCMPSFLLLFVEYVPLFSFPSHSSSYHITDPTLLLVAVRFSFISSTNSRAADPAPATRLNALFCHPHRTCIHKGQTHVVLVEYANCESATSDQKFEVVCRAKQP